MVLAWDFERQKLMVSTAFLMLDGSVEKLASTLFSIWSYPQFCATVDSDEDTDLFRLSASLW
eukprot:4189392-Amphidinium_carterae.3